MKYAIAFAWGGLVASGIWATATLPMPEDTRSTLIAFTIILTVAAGSVAIWLALE